MGFEWRTDDEESTPPGWREEKRMRRVRRPRWIWYIVMLVVAAGAVAYLWRLAERRIDASVTQLEADVRLSQSLVERAAATNDPELLRTVLSGRNDEWAETQRELLAAGKGYTSIARLVGLEPDGPAEEQSLTLNAELRSAELVVTQRYTPTLFSPVSEPTVLEHTYVFRRGANRWLLAPPEPDFWGPKHSLQTAIVTVNFPERDGSIVRRLVNDLVADVDSFCAQLQQGCPQDLHLTVTFESGIDSIAQYEDGRAMLASGTAITLPSPSLLGIPQDDAGYEALHTAYARYLFSALAPGFTPWECCEQVVFWQALLQARLHDMGLAPPLLSSSDTIAALELVTDVERFFVDLSQKWNSQRPISLHTPLPLDVRILVAFLLAQNQTAQNMQLSLNQPTVFHRWWSSFTSFAPTDRDAVRPDLVSFVQSHYEPPPPPSGLALPIDDLLLVCGDWTSSSSPQYQSVWRYDLAAGTWAEELALEGAQLATLVTDEERYFVTSLLFGEEDGDTMQLSVWRAEAGEPPVLMAGDAGPPWLALAKHGPVVPAAFFDNTQSGEPVFGTLDLRTCSDDGCTGEEAPGYVVPSPGGENELATRALFDSPGLFVRPSGGEWKELPQQGFSPFWIDDQTFAYLESPSTSLAQVAMPNVRLVVQTLDNQSAVLAESRQPGQAGEPDLYLHGLGGFYHAASDRIFLLATDQNQGTTTVLSVPRPSGGSWLAPEPVAPEVVATAEGSPSYGITLPVAAQARWLVLMLNQPRTQYPALWLVDLTGAVAPWLGATTPDIWLLPSYDWNPDGDWLAWLSDGAIRLAAPAYRDASGEPYQLLIPHERQVCGYLAWLAQ